MLITGLCSFRTHVGVTELILMQILYLFRFLVCCTELILITDLCSFETPVGVYRDITERILILQNLFLYGSTRKYYLFKCPKIRTLVLISNLSYTHTGVPVGTTEFILIRSLYGGTRRYNRD